MEGILMFTIKVTDINGNNHQWIGNETESVLDGAQRNGVKIPIRLQRRRVWAL